MEYFAGCLEKNMCGCQNNFGSRNYLFVLSSWVIILSINLKCSWYARRNRNVYTHCEKVRCLWYNMFYIYTVCYALFSCVYIVRSWPHFYQTRSAWSMDQGSNENHSPVNNFAPTVTKFCVMWEGQALPHDPKFGKCRDKIVDSRSFLSWSLIHGSSWSGLIKVGPGEFMWYLPIFFRITSLGSACPIASELTHLSLDKMAAISQTIFSDRSLFIRVQLTIIQHWFR